MPHIKISREKTEYPYELWRLREDFPNTSFAMPYEVNDLDEYGVFFVASTELPEFNPLTHKALELTPVQIDGVWTQQWDVVELTREEIAAQTPQSITRAQAVGALIIAGLDELVEPAIESIADPLQRKLALNDWRNRLHFERTNPTLLVLAAALGLNDAQLDDLFRVGATL